MVSSTLRLREIGDGRCTDGSSIRHDTSLRILASRLSVLMPREPTPSVRTMVAGTIRTSWPASLAASATENASEQVSSTTRLGGYFFSRPFNLAVRSEEHTSELQSP